jgi:hypothetical protein
MDIAYEPRKGSDRNVEEMLRDAQLNLADDTTEEERLTALCNLQTAIECAKYKVCLILNFLLYLAPRQKNVVEMFNKWSKISILTKNMITKIKI